MGIKAVIFDLNGIVLTSELLSDRMNRDYEVEPDKFIDALKMILRLVNIGDAKSLACHPASTTHRQLNSDELAAAVVSEDMVRISVGIEHIEDIIADVKQALEAAK